MKNFMARWGTWRGVALIGAALLMMAAPGCLVTNSKHETHAGIDVPQETFEQIKIGATTEQWVKATLGEPTSRTGDWDDQIWKYVYTTRTDSHGAVFLIFGGSDVKKTQSDAFIEFKSGIVANKWRTEKGG